MGNESVFFETDEQETPPANGGGEQQPPTGGGDTPRTSSGGRASTTNSDKFVEETYNEVYATLTDEQRANLGKDANTLELVRVLGLGSKKDSRKVGGTDGKMIKCDKPVALEFKTSVDIMVPVLPVTTTIKSEIDFTKVEQRPVKAGETFQVTYFEAMLLLIRDEYMGTFRANGADNEGYLAVSLPKYLDNAQAIPTPAYNFRNSAFKENIFRMDEQKEDGSWVIKEEFAHYAEFLKKTRTNRATDSTAKANRQQKVSLTLQKAFGLRA